MTHVQSKRPICTVTALCPWTAHWRLQAEARGCGLPAPGELRVSELRTLKVVTPGSPSQGNFQDVTVLS